MSMKPNHGSPALAVAAVVVADSAVVAVAATKAFIINNSPKRGRPGFPSSCDRYFGRPPRGPKYGIEHAPLALKCKATFDQSANADRTAAKQIFLALWRIACLRCELWLI